MLKIAKTALCVTAGLLLAAGTGFSAPASDPEQAAAEAKKTPASQARLADAQTPPAPRGRPAQPRPEKALKKDNKTAAPLKGKPAGANENAGKQAIAVKSPNNSAQKPGGLFPKSFAKATPSHNTTAPSGASMFDSKPTYGSPTASNPSGATPSGKDPGSSGFSSKSLFEKSGNKS